MFSLDLKQQATITVKATTPAADIITLNITDTDVAFCLLVCAQKLGEGGFSLGSTMLLSDLRALRLVRRGQLLREMFP
jgi:hypothetical protein